VLYKQQCPNIELGGNTDLTYWPGLILIASTTGLITEGTLVH